MDVTYELRAKPNRELVIIERIVNESENEVAVGKQMLIEVEGRGISVYEFEFDDKIVYKNHIKSYNTNERGSEEIKSALEKDILNHTSMGFINYDFINKIMYMINNENIHYELRDEQKLNDVFTLREESKLLEVQ